MNKDRITITPLTRIEGHARITIDLDRDGSVADARLNVVSLRGFEQLLLGRAAEEVPRIVTRICGICPWMHHLAATLAVERCFDASVPAAAHLLRELCQVMAHVSDKILHFFFLAGPDLFLPDEDEPRGLAELTRLQPEMARQAAEMLRLGHRLLDMFTGRSIHPVAAVPGGFSRPMTPELRRTLTLGLEQLLDFALQALDLGNTVLEARFPEPDRDPDLIQTGFLGSVNGQGELCLYNGRLRLMSPDGHWHEFAVDRYRDYIQEESLSWSYGKMVRARCWNQPFSLDPDRPGSIYRVNTLARINVCDRIATPRAHEALEEFRARFGRPAQATCLFHHARLIELVHCCERALELLDDEQIMTPAVRKGVIPKAGHGIGHVEAPRGTLIHEYETDENGYVRRANIIVGTGHNLAPMNLGVKKTAARLIEGGRVDRAIRQKIAMAVRAYDP